MVSEQAKIKLYCLLSRVKRAVTSNHGLHWSFNELVKKIIPRLQLPLTQLSWKMMLPPLFFDIFHTLFLVVVLNSRPFVTIPTSGATKSTSTSQEARLGLTITRPSYQPTGIHLSPRFVLEWWSANISTSFSSTSMPTLCTHWSPTGNIAPLHWVVTSGRLWLLHRSPYKSTVTRKGWMLWVRLLPILKQESVSLITNKMTAVLVTQVWYRRASGWLQHMW